MLFNSIAFLFFFLPVVLVGFYLLQSMRQRTWQMLWLTAASLFFYGWWNPKYVLLLVLSASVNYSIGLALARSKAKSGRVWLILGILFNLGMLAYFKYANWLLDSVAVVLDTSFHFEQIVLPLAISFYTFQQITYLADTRNGLTKPHGFLEYCLFVSFFPQLIAGPIVHHSEMLEQFEQLDKPADRSAKLTIGFSLLVIGLFKKVVIADTFAQFSSPMFELAANGAMLNALDIGAGLFSYAFQLYFDFSGYSDMAIGLACLFGIKLPVNFFSPYRAQNISDFWRMWHATLSRFLRDYVYTPLGGFLCSPARQRFNLFVAMFAGGLWHGAGWTFVVYGLCHGSYVLLHQLWRVKLSGPRGWVVNRYYKSGAQVFTFLVVVLTLVFFRADSIPTAMHIFSRLFEASGTAFLPTYLAEIETVNVMTLEKLLLGKHYSVATVYGMLVVALAACWTLPSAWQLFQRYDIAIAKPRAGRPAVLPLEWRPGNLWVVAIATMAFLSLLNLTEVSEFLYFQF